MNSTTSTPKRQKAALTSSTDDAALLPMDALVGASSQSRAKLYADIKTGKVPQADVRLGPRCVRWRAGTVRAWLRGLGEQEKSAA